MIKIIVIILVFGIQYGTTMWGHSEVNPSIIVDQPRHLQVKYAFVLKNIMH